MPSFGRTVLRFRWYDHFLLSRMIFGETATPKKHIGADAELTGCASRSAARGRQFPRTGRDDGYVSQRQDCGAWPVGNTAHWRVFGVPLRRTSGRARRTNRKKGSDHPSFEFPSDERPLHSVRSSALVASKSVSGRECQRIFPRIARVGSTRSVSYGGGVRVCGNEVFEPSPPKRNSSPAKAGAREEYRGRLPPRAAAEHGPLSRALCSSTERIPDLRSSTGKIA